MISITFQCANIEELNRDMRAFLYPQPTVKMNVPLKDLTSDTSLLQMTEVIKDANVDGPQTEFDLTLPNKLEEKKPRSRRTRAEMEAARNNLAEGSQVKVHNDGANEFPEEVKVAPAKSKLDKPTREAVHVALQQVNSACGLPKAREILKEFEAQRISELKEEKYQSFIEKCDAAVIQA